MTKQQIIKKIEKLKIFKPKSMEDKAIQLWMGHFIGQSDMKYRILKELDKLLQ